MPDHAPPTRDEVIAMEKRYWTAVMAQDGDRAAELSADPSVIAGPRGVMSVPRNEMSAMTKAGGWRLNAFDFEDVEVTIPAPDVAVIAYTLHQNITMNGEARTMRAADCSTWVRSESGWRCCAHSETLLDPA